MPTYEYACTNAECGNRFELVQSFSDPSATECPVCGERVRKVFGAVGVVFKGSGFYRTDSRDGANREKASSETKAASDTKSAGESKSSDSSTPGSSDSSSKSSDSSSPASNGSAAKKPAAKPAAATA